MKNSADINGAIAPGDRLLAGRYQVRQLLGKRAGRQTLLADDLQAQVPVVIKLLSLSKDFQWQDLKLFEREAEVLRTLSHAAIPRYVDFLDLDTPTHKGFALVQSYVEGKSLEQHLKAGRTFSEAEVKELAIALLKILDYLHQHSPPVIHRDIKPSNILLTNRSGNSVGQVHLVDFGSVQTIAAQAGGTITVVGTYGYMPPEQFGGRATPASDLYSLGATLIFLATGQHPTELPQQELRIQFQAIARLSREFSDWLAWLTEPSLDRRLASAQAALSALNQPRQRLSAVAQADVVQPAGSHITLTKTAKALTVALPPQGLSLGFLAGFSFLCPLVLLWLPFSALAVSNSLPVMLLTAATGGVGVLIWLLLRLFKQTWFYIDAHTIARHDQLFHLQWNCHVAQRQGWKEIEFKPKRPKSYSLTAKTAANELILWVGDRPLRPGQTGSLTNEELRWLAVEIQDWLTRTRPPLDEAIAMNRPIVDEE